MGSDNYSGEGNFYSGANYGFDPKLNEEWSVGVSAEYAPTAGQIGHAIDATTANQLGAVSKKLNTGAKVMEVQGLNIMGGPAGAMMDKIPKQHLEEMYRLKKLTGAELTFHAPMIEPTGISKQGWDEDDRLEAERQLWSAVKRAKVLDDEGNLVVTFHSGVVNVPTVTKIKNENGQEVIKEIMVVDIGKGGFSRLTVKPNYFLGEEGKILSIAEQEKKITKDLKKQSREEWFGKLFNVAYHANHGTDIVEKTLHTSDKEGAKKTLEMYKQFLKGGGTSEILEGYGAGENARESVNNLVHGDTYLRGAYQDLQNLFNQAYETAKANARMNNKKDDLERLNKFREKMKKQIEGIEDPTKLQAFGKVITEGVNVLRSVEEPALLQPMRDFTLDKSSDTFSNLAFNSYAKFKENAPIISIENPPAGSAPLDRAEDLRALVEKTRKKLVAKLVDKGGLSESAAKKQAEKLVGVTWDVGHINMIRKFGYEEKDVVKQSEIVAPYVKHVHLSDNFGLEHTELPMGMGNVPIGKILALKQGFEKAKKIVETGDWFSRQGGLAMTHSPVQETLRAFGSPIYAMQMAPTWAGAGMQGGYFSGYGATLPQRHFQTYGAGFSGLPQELGGQVAGVSRASGTPVD